MKVWLLDDCDYVAGEALDEVLRWYESETGVLADEHDEMPLTMMVNVAEDAQDSRSITFEASIRERIEAGETLPMIVGTDPHYA